ncbi:hypothetical protein Cgig2_018763 [Carnegiea gigantea]|uniref:Uncharacterized protein n=1 Tax=Carnegiea gigantea TaxID=171969 RepID=A0A9Q1GN16_9CARY|nr:hypothetical protein Cgig2_018763 [Carnegiea gigantea]
MRESSALRQNPLPEDYHDLCPSFDLGVVTQYAHDSNIPEMVQTIFYTIVHNDTAELGLSCTMNGQDDVTPRVRTSEELLADGTLEGNPYSASSPQPSRAELFPTSSSSSSVGTSASSSLDGVSASSSLKGSSASSSTDEALTSSSAQAAPGTPGRAMLNKRGRTSAEPVLEVVAEGLGPENTKGKSSDKEPWNWLPRCHPRTDSGRGRASSGGREACLVNVAAKKGVVGTPKATRAISQIARETPAGTRACPTNSLAVDSVAKLELVQDLAKSWDLIALRTSEPIKVTEEEVAVAEFSGTLNEALSKAKAILAKAKDEVVVGVEKAVKAEELGHQRGREESKEFLCKVLATLAPGLQEDNYFEAYLCYVEEHQRAEAEGRDLKEVEFIPPSDVGDEDEGSTPLDDKAGTSDDEGPGDGGANV